MRIALLVIALVGPLALAQTPQSPAGNPSAATVDIADVVVATCAALALLVSIVSVFLAGRASRLNKKMFKRQGIIDLHMAWSGISEIDTMNPVTPDVVKAVNALDLTAALWNHDVVEKLVLYQSYWDSYRDIYNTLDGSKKLVQGINRRCCDLITKEITRAYEDMKKVTLDEVRQTKL
ncbi:MAG: hypothetical protein KAI66_23950 [Lentisphaeria bacterium]|nr:hypothetical protein [Lentisphaeria bacterium]